MIASLSMYASPTTTAACDRFWKAWANRMRAVGIQAPTHLTYRDEPESVWTDPSLLVSQTCGYPYASRLRGKTRLVATPHYDVEGCNDANYVSWIVVRMGSAITDLEQLRGMRATVNGRGSQSGYNSFRAVIAPLANRSTFFSEVLCSGSHAQSMRDVADGVADCAAIDAVSWALACDAEPDVAERLTRIAMTPAVPGLPFITVGTCVDDDLSRLRQTLQQTLRDPDMADDLAKLKIMGASVVPDAAYNACLDMENIAVAAGYPALV